MEKFYGVWIGRVPGIYESWDECKSQTHGYPNAKFKKLNASNKKDAILEFESLKESYTPSVNGNKSQGVRLSSILNQNAEKGEKPIGRFLTVDGASNGKNCEFQAVWYPDGEKVFASPVYTGGTNNIAEFLGLVRAIRYLKDNRLDPVVYTDSVTAITWVMNKRANTTARFTQKLTSDLEFLISNSENFLVSNKDFMKKVKIMKWHTKEWGEIPADYGRK